jgi:hypothetical protein
VELYDHSKDPHEWKNEADNPEYANVLRRLAKRLPPIAEMAPQIVRGQLSSLATEPQGQ